MSKEAARPHQKAKEMDQMVEAYRKEPGQGRRLMSHAPKEDFVQQSKRLAALYTDAAREADALAQSHRDMIR